MALTLRLIKGDLLTWQELDDNFTFLDSKIDNLPTGSTIWEAGTGDSSAQLISSGTQGTVAGDWSIMGGYINTIDGNFSAGFGYNNSLTSSGNYGIVGGRDNTISAEHSFIFGFNNTSGGSYSFTAGQGNTVEAGSNYSYVFGNSNSILTGTLYSSVFGGTGNIIQGTTTRSAIISSESSTINSGSNNTVILGGSGITATESNSVYVPDLRVEGTTVNVDNLPTSETGLSNGDLWNDNGLVKVTPASPTPAGYSYKTMAVSDLDTPVTYDPDVDVYTVYGAGSVELVIPTSITYSPNTPTDTRKISIVNVSGGVVQFSEPIDGNASFTIPINESRTIVDTGVGYGGWRTISFSTY